MTSEGKDDVDDDLSVRYQPTYETVLITSDDEEDDGDRSTASSLPPPPPMDGASILKDLRNTLLTLSSSTSLPSSARTKSTKQKKVVVGIPPKNHHPKETITIQDDEDDDADSTIEVEAGIMSSSWCHRKATSMSGMSQGRRRRRIVMCLGMVLLVVVLVAMLGLSLGLSTGKKNEKRTTGSSDMLVGGEEGGEEDETPEVETMVPTSSPIAMTMQPSIAVIPETTIPDTITPDMTTEVPTDLSTTTTTLSECISFVAPLETCVSPFSGISIYFRNCQPEEGDWIGLWSIDDDTDDGGSLPEPIQWLSHCGSQDCTETDEEDIVFFGAGLPSGTYVSHMVRLVEMEAPYTSSFAGSDIFQVSSDCGK